MPSSKSPDFSGGERYQARIAAEIASVDGAVWDACAGSDNPFVRHAFLLALEESGSVGPATGWLPQHLLLEDADGCLIGAVPLYLKEHSYGEYVFDHAWADAYQRAGGQYYPKLQAAVPFTPVPGPRLLVHPADAGTMAGRRAALIAALQRLTSESGLSSLHVTFPDKQDTEALEQAGFLMRMGCQYHWENRGYREFADFLAALSARKRKAIRKEREAIAAAGIEHRIYSGDALETRHWDTFFAFYIDTGSRKWGRPYLTRAFFESLGQRMAEEVVLILAEKNGQPIAGALNLRGRTALYGRHWGTCAGVPFLHFETCYYQAIDYAIAHGLERVEAGAQGEHKIQRGYLPVPTWSAHWIVHDGFRAAIADFLIRERTLLEAEMATLETFSPYRQS